MVAALIAIGVVGVVLVVQALRQDDDVFRLARSTDVTRLTALLERAPHLATSLNRDGESPMHIAAKMGSIEVLDLLHARGADVNSRTEEGVTPLHFASAFNEIAAVQWLLDHGANLAAKESSGFTPLEAARARGHSELVIFLEARAKSQRLVDETLSNWLARPALEMDEGDLEPQIGSFPSNEVFRAKTLH